MALLSEQPSFGDLQTSPVDFSKKSCLELRWVEDDREVINS